MNASFESSAVPFCNVFHESMSFISKQGTVLKETKKYFQHKDCNWKVNSEILGLLFQYQNQCNYLNLAILDQAYPIR